MMPTRLLTLSIVLLAFPCRLPADDCPNIVFFFTDDQTTSTLGCYGNSVVQTPNIDALARRGTRFENAFVSHSICWVSRTTIRTALANLETSGFIRRVHGEGTFIAKKPAVIANPLDTIKSFYPHMTSRAGLPARVTNLAITTVEADDDLAQRSGLTVGTHFTQVARVVEVDQTPVAYFVDSIPETTVTAGEMEAGFRDNVMDYLWHKGVDVAWYRMKVIAARAQAPLDSLLGVNPGSILFKLDGEFVTEQGEFVNASAAYFVPESVELTLWRKVEHGERHPVPEEHGTNKS